MRPDSSIEVIRFGEYTLDPAAGELRKFDRKIALPDQPIQILALLLERPGEVVTRDQVIARLWPAGTVVDFEHGINSSVRRLRAALNDSADRPRYIETLPKRGYRFIAEVAPSHEMTPDPSRALIAPLPTRARSWTNRVWISTAMIIALSAVALVIARVRERARAPITSVAVLPFVNSGKDARIDYLADGITEQIINRLSGVRQIRVIARTSAFQFKGTGVVPRQAGRTLGVGAVATGRVALTGDDLTVQAELMQVSDGTQLWGEKYTRRIADVQALEAEVASEIAGRLGLGLAGDAQSQVARRYTDNSEAYELYLRAVYTPGAQFREAKKYLEQAIAIDPSFGLAYAYLAGLVEGEATIRYVDAAEGLKHAKALANKALELDNRNGLAHLVLSEVRCTLDWDWPGAETEIKLAIEDLPGPGHAKYAAYLAQVGKPQQAWAEMQRAFQIDPMSPDLRALLVFHYHLTGQYQRAVEASELPGVAPSVSGWRAFSLTELGRFDEAIRLLRGGYWPETAGALGHIGYAYARAGNKAEAEKIRSELQRRARDQHVGAYEIAFISAALGQADEAFQWLDVACEHRDPGLKYLKVEPGLKPLASDPRFRALLLRVGLPQ